MHHFLCVELAFRNNNKIVSTTLLFSEEGVGRFLPSSTDFSEIRDTLMSVGPSACLRIFSIIGDSYHVLSLQTKWLK